MQRSFRKHYPRAVRGEKASSSTSTGSSTSIWPAVPLFPFSDTAIPRSLAVDGVRGDHLLLAPPAVTTRAEIHRGIGELRHAIREVHP